MSSESKKMLTIEHIARLAKVSKGTVSKVLNNRPGISQATRERVLALVEEFDFTPNSAAQALANQKTGNIGIIVPHEAGHSLSGAYWSLLITSVASTAINNGYNLLVLTPKHEGAIEDAYEPVLRTKKVDGLIIGSEHLDRKSISRLLLQSIPFVMIGRNPEFLHYHVDVENYQAAFDIVSYMFDHGYKSPAILTGPGQYHYNQRRIAGYRAALQSHGVGSEFIHSVRDYETEDIRRHTREMFETGGFDSLFIGAGGAFLFDVIDEMRELGIPFSDYGLTVFDDYRYLDFIEPRMTAVRQPISDLGSSAMEMLLTLMSGEDPDESEVIIPASIIPRSSCGEDR
ncbi:LacI family DNA-binding transcriptional regulator [Spirochaeta dissipatitropha]